MGSLGAAVPHIMIRAGFPLLNLLLFFSLPVYALSEELTVPGPDADFDADSDVDGDDFLSWQRGAGDADGNGTSDSVDLAFWGEQYGTSGNSSALFAASQAVPEPSGIALVLLAASLAVSETAPASLTAELA